MIRAYRPDPPVAPTRRSVTVVVCTRDRPTELTACLGALARFPGIELLVVDNASADDASKRVSESAGARYVMEPIPGLSRARNLGWRQARGEIVAYLDDDARPESGWVDALVRPFSDDSVMVVTGQILPPHFHWAGEEAFRLDADASDWRGRSLFGGAGAGSNMAFRRSFLEQSGGFDEAIGRGRIVNVGEEHEAFYRVLERGFVLAYEPGAIVHHPYDSSRECCAYGSYYACSELPWASGIPIGPEPGDVRCCSECGRPSAAALCIGATGGPGAGRRSPSVPSGPRDRATGFDPFRASRRLLGLRIPPGDVLRDRGSKSSPVREGHSGAVWPKALNPTPFAGIDCVDRLEPSLHVGCRVVFLACSGTGPIPPPKQGPEA